MSARLQRMRGVELEAALRAYEGRQDLTAADIERATAIVCELNYRRTIWNERFGRALAEMAEAGR